MKIEQLPDGRYRLRWYIAGRGSPRRQKTFPRGTRKKQVEAFAANLEVRRAMGELALYEQRKRPLQDLSREWPSTPSRTSPIGRASATSACW
jgi:hypothetical protein